MRAEKATEVESSCCGWEEEEKWDVDAYGGEVEPVAGNDGLMTSEIEPTLPPPTRLCISVQALLFMFLFIGSLSLLTAAPSTPSSSLTAPVEGEDDEGAEEEEGVFDTRLRTSELDRLMLWLSFTALASRISNILFVSALEPARETSASCLIALHQVGTTAPPEIYNEGLLAIILPATISAGDFWMVRILPRPSKRASSSWSD